MSPANILLLALLIGILSGLRTFTATAATAWSKHLGWLALPRYFAWIGTLPAVATLTVLALVELVYDKLPNIPPRTAPRGLTARIVTGTLTGACIAAAGAQRTAVGAALGAIGAIAGAFGGYQVRKRLVKATGAPDFVIGVMEDLVTIGGSLWVVTRF